MAKYHTFKSALGLGSVASTTLAVMGVPQLRLAPPISPLLRLIIRASLPLPSTYPSGQLVSPVRGGDGGGGDGGSGGDGGGGNGGSGGDGGGGDGGTAMQKAACRL
jgi:hypothetical protein